MGFGLWVFDLVFGRGKFMDKRGSNGFLLVVLGVDRVVGGIEEDEGEVEVI